MIELHSRNEKVRGSILRLFLGGNLILEEKKYIVFFKKNIHKIFGKF